MPTKNPPPKSTILAYPRIDSGKTRVWLKFYQVDYKQEDDGRIVDYINPDAPVIYLYSSGNVAFADAASWSESELERFGYMGEKALKGGFLGAQDRDLLKMGGDAAQAIFAGVGQNIDAIANIFEGKALHPALVSALAARIPMAGVRAGVRSATRYTANPHQRAIFKQVGLRKFSFNFTLIPTSAEEAETIKRIIKFFRANAYPELADISDATTDQTTRDFFRDFYYRFPSMLRISLLYLNEEGKFEETLGFKFQDCFIESVNTVFDPDGSQSILSDGSTISFPSTTLTISVGEDRALSKSDVQTGGY